MKGFFLLEALIALFLLMLIGLITARSLSTSLHFIKAIREFERTDAPENVRCQSSKLHDERLHHCMEESGKILHIKVSP